MKVSKKLTGITLAFFCLVFLTLSYNLPASAHQDGRTGAPAGTSHLYLPRVNRVTVFRLTGRIRDTAAGAMPGVTVYAGGRIAATTAADGVYTLYLAAGSYTLTPSRSNQTFVPLSPQVIVPTGAGQQDFICTNCLLPGGKLNLYEMVTVPAGTFRMGCAQKDAYCQTTAESPMHTVYLDAYDIDMYEVTNARYKTCVDAGGCSVPNYSSFPVYSSYFGDPAYADHPVVGVTWDQAAAFCAWEGKRLPTEAEWEKAARGSDTRIYPWGDALPDCSYGNMSYCSRSTDVVGIHPAGASPYGAQDMAGNVWEWVSDWYQENYYNSQSVWNNPTGPASGSFRVLRGGSWSLYWYSARVSYRIEGNLYQGSNSLGFRCAASH
jgi:formylglycine-generating enzyme required for sulfatase activity